MENVIAYYDVRENFAGIHLEESENNAIYWNNLEANSMHNAHDDGLNRWDDGVAGNHYGDHDDPNEGCIGSGKYCDTPTPSREGPAPTDTR